MWSLDLNDEIEILNISNVEFFSKIFECSSWENEWSEIMYYIPSKNYIINTRKKKRKIFKFIISISYF